MGQKASPLSARLGLTMYWDNMWDDKLNFSKKLKEDIFINMFLFLIFKGSCYNNNKFFSTKNIYYWTSLLSNSNKDFSTLNDVFFLFDSHSSFFKNFYFNKLERVKYKKYYISKIWILRVQNWTVITFYIYIPQNMKQQSSNDFSNKNFFLKKKQNKFILNKNYFSNFKKLNEFNCNSLLNWWFVSNLFSLNQANDNYNLNCFL